MDVWPTTPIFSSQSWYIQRRHLAVCCPSSILSLQKYRQLPCVQPTIPSINNSTGNLQLDILGCRVVMMHCGKVRDIGSVPGMLTH